MEYRTLGRTGVEVSVIAMGCWAIVGDSTWGEQDEENAIEAIECAMEKGVNFFDTAEAYGDGYSEKLLGETLGGRRNEVVIATKVSPDNLSPEDLRKSCEASLKRLQTDYIDLYQIHWPNDKIRIEHTMEELEKLKDEGKIRVIGCSNFGLRDLTGVLECGRVEVDQLAYNMLWRGVEAELQEKCVSEGVSVLAYSPIQQGLLTGKFETPDDVPVGRARTRHFSKERARTRHGEEGAEELTFQAIEGIHEVAESLGEPMVDVALAWLLEQPAVASVLAGMRNATQARQNARAGGLELPDESLKKLDLVTRPLKERFSGELDMWQSESRIR